MATLTVSQGLRLSKKLKGQLSELETRAGSAVWYKDADTPAYNFSAVMEEISSTRTELVKLQARIRATNAVTKFDFEGKPCTLTLATCLLEGFKSQIMWFKSLGVRDHEKQIQDVHEYTDEGKRVTTKATYICAFTTKQRDDKVTALQESFDKLNDLVETTNHRTSLIDV